MSETIELSDGTEVEIEEKYEHTWLLEKIRMPTSVEQDIEAGGQASQETAEWMVSLIERCTDYPISEASVDEINPDDIVFMVDSIIRLNEDMELQTIEDFSDSPEFTTEETLNNLHGWKGKQ